MKKLIGLLVITALVMGSVAAQSLSMNYRTQATILNVNDLTADKPVAEFFNLNENGVAYESRARDDLTITFSGEKAGASVTLEPNVQGLNTTIGANAYYGWASFGPLKLTAGKFDSRYTGRVSGFAGNYNGIVGEYVKLGGLKDATMIEDAANLGVSGTAARVHTLIADLTIDKLLIKLAFQDYTTGSSNNHDGDIEVNDDGTFVWAPTSVSLGYSIDPFGTIEGIFRLLAKDVIVLGAYIRPNKLVPNLDAVVGFTFGMDNTGTDMASEMGIDVRAQYTIDKLLLATNMNFMKYKNDEWGMWIAASGNYKINDTLTGRLTVSYIDESKQAGGEGKSFNGLLGLEIIAMRNSSISTGVELRYDLAAETARLMIPCILRVRL